MKTKQWIWVFAILVISFVSCKKERPTDLGSVNYRNEMRNFVIKLSTYAKQNDSNFIIIPQNGQELIIDKNELQREYMQSFDATGREDLFYGYNKDDEPTPEAEKNAMLELCNLCKQNHIEVLTTDYCYTPNKIDNSYTLNQNYGFISFAANKRDLNTIPEYPAKPFNSNNTDIRNISQAKNFLYLINPERYTTKQDFINAIMATDYDVVIMDLFHNEVAFTATEVEQLKTKHNGGKRMVICYISIGEAENYRYYWQTGWKPGKPDFIEKEDVNWEGNFYVKYWNTDWQNIIFGTESSYLKKIMDAGFNGAYLDLIDAFEYFENK